MADNIGKFEFRAPSPGPRPHLLPPAPDRRNPSNQIIEVPPSLLCEFENEFGIVPIAPHPITAQATGGGFIAFLQQIHHSDSSLFHAAFGPTLSLIFPIIWRQICAMLFKLIDRVSPTPVTKY